MKMFPSRTLLLLVTLLLIAPFHSSFAIAEDVWSEFGREWQPLHECLTGERETFQLQAKLEISIDGKPQPVEIQLIRYDDDAFDFAALHPEYSVRIYRRAEETVFELPHHQKRFVATGEVDTKDHLATSGLLTRLVDADSQIAPYLPMLATPPQAFGLILGQLVDLTHEAKTDRWALAEEFHLSFPTPAEKENWSVSIESPVAQAELQLSSAAAETAIPALPAGFQAESINRTMLERQLCRGVRRTIAIFAPSTRLTSPKQRNKTVEHGELRWQEGQRIVLLSGTPEQMGRAHAQLLPREATRCRDSVLYAFGTVQTIRTGRWFQHDLEQAYQQLAPYIPEDHKTELTALAAELKWDPQMANVLNVFPELFHCSGFAVFGSATSDGTLYHGRVLDYMTTIGLQYSAATFVVAPEGKIPFASVGYGGFTGSVTGMNAAGISLGEMGGRGEGQWDGVPMATLMRMALEGCRTLDEVKTLWAESPRTCEYYYVFADGNTNQAVGVAATPDSIEFVEPGQAHPLLGEGIADAVVLSAGSRLEKLRERVQEKHGQIDVETALWLMNRPVAMQSNLHNALFVPEHGYLYVAHADHKRPAAERPYVKIDLQQLLREMASQEKQAARTP